jgi:hypothetical protein
MDGTPSIGSLNITLSSISSPSPKKAPQGAIDARLKAVTPQASLTAEASGLVGFDAQASTENAEATDAMPEVEISKVITHPSVEPHALAPENNHNTPRQHATNPPPPKLQRFTQHASWRASQLLSSAVALEMLQWSKP